MPTLDFHVPFTGFADLSFYNCFAAAYVYLEGFEPVTDYDCARKTTGNCTGCGNCRKTLSAIQEDWYFIFGTFTGDFSHWEMFDGNTADRPPHEDESYVDFCMKLAGYTYQKVTSDFKSALVASIDNARPVIAVLKDRKKGACRLLIGYDGDTTLMANPKGSQNEDAVAPQYDEIEYLYVITACGQPTCTLLDGLKNIERTLVSVLERGVWEDFRRHFAFWDGGLKDKPFEETKATFARATQLCWNFDHCHNVAETFRHQVFPALQDDRLEPYRNEIDRAYDNSHNSQWAMMALHDCRDWSKREWESKEWGMCIYAEWTIDQLKKNDEDVLASIRGMIKILEK